MSTSEISDIFPIPGCMIIASWNGKFPVRYYVQLAVISCWKLFFFFCLLLFLSSSFSFFFPYLFFFSSFRFFFFFLFLWYNISTPFFVTNIGTSLVKFLLIACFIVTKIQKCCEWKCILLIVCDAVRPYTTQKNYSPGNLRG